MSLKEDYLLAIDHGTQSIRAGVFDLRGNPVTIARRTIEPYFSAQPGWAEQNPDYFWEELCQVCQELWQTCPVPPEAIRGMALTTQRGTVVNVDREGKPLRPAIIWLDQRLARGVTPVKGTWGVLFKTLRLERDITRVQAEAEANWIRLNQPDIWTRTHKFLLLSGYLTYRLTGRFVDSVASQVGYLPFDVKRANWAGPRDWRWQAIPLDRDCLPELVQPGEMLGQITPQAAQATGIRVGLPVIAAASDKACEVLGSGGLEPQIGCLSFGTTATLNTTHSKYLEVIPMLPPYPGPVPGTFNPEVDVKRGYWMVSWFKREFALHERQVAASRGIEAEELFDELVNCVPPGSMGLTLQPYWMPGFKVLGPEAKGAIIGFGEIHTRSHLYRAILEGLAYALREGKERTEKRSGVKITELRVSGGGARSEAALQLTADIFGLPVARLHTTETSILGAAVAAAVGLKLHPDFKSAVKEMTRLGPGPVFTPNPSAQATYDQLYKRVYLEMYQKLQPLYLEIQKITGYPDRV